jgi:hypothetical protein
VDLYSLVTRSEIGTNLGESIVWICLFMSKSLHSELEQNTRVLLDSLQQKGEPPIYTINEQLKRFENLKQKLEACPELQK